MIKKSITILSFFLSLNAFSWGHLRYFSSHPEMAQGFLIFDVLQKASIDYCIQVPAHSRFFEQDLTGEVEAALQTWLQPIIQITEEQITITRSHCDEDLFDLQIMLVPNHADGANFHLLKAGSTRPAVRIRLFEGDSFSSLAALKGISQQEFSHKQTELTLAGYWKDRDRYGVKAHWSIYRTLLHEFGHAFGLCDTASTSLTTCDSSYHSPEHPPSMMKKASSYALSGDDVQGVKSLITRFDH